MTSFDPNSLLQFAGYGVFIIFMFYGQKIQMLQMMAVINQKMKRLLVLRNSAIEELRKHIKKHIADLNAEQDKQLTILIDSIAIPPVSHLDPAGLVPKLENIYKTYDRYLKNGIRRIVNIPKVEPIDQAALENMTNSLEVAIELSVFYKVVEHFVKLAKKAGPIAVYQIAMILPMLMEMGEALGSASGHFASGEPMGDGFGPMVAARFANNFGDVQETEFSDSETTVKYLPNVMGRNVFTVKAKGPGGSVGNPGKVTQVVIEAVKPSLVITIDAGLKLESEKLGDISEGVGVAMGGPGMDRFRIEEALAKFDVPVLTVVCKMGMKEAISRMPKEVLDQVEEVYKRVFRMISENSEQGQTVVVIGVGNTMGV